MIAGFKRTKSRSWSVIAVALAALLGWEIKQGGLPGGAADQQHPVTATAITARAPPEPRTEDREPAYRPSVAVTTPKPAPVTEQPPASPQRGRIVLLGTTIADDARFAFVRDVSGAGSQVVRKGDRVNGLLVTEIQPDRLELTDGSTSQEVILEVGDEIASGAYAAASQRIAPAAVAAPQQPNVMGASGAQPAVPVQPDAPAPEEDEAATSNH